MTAALGLLLLTGCVGSAPELPPDTTSLNRTKSLSLADFSASDAAMSCDAINAERVANATAIQQANGPIEDNRTRNQVAGYLGALFLVPYLATDNNNAEKEQIRQLYSRHDTLITLAGVKHCPPPQLPAN